MFTTSKPPLQPRHRSCRPIPTQCALPDDRYTPAGYQQFLSRSQIALNVSLELRLPETRSGGRHGRVGAAIVTVPEASMNEADSSEATECQVGLTGKFPIMEPVSEATPMKCSAESKFRFRVLAGDARHHARSGRLIHYIDHHLCCPVCDERSRRGISPEVVHAIKVHLAGWRRWSPGEFLVFREPDRAMDFALAVRSSTWVTRRTGVSPILTGLYEFLSTYNSGRDLLVDIPQ